MAKDDYLVIAYKILKFLDECNKRGISPKLEDICCDCKLFSIPEKYLLSVMTELIDQNYIKGFMLVNTKDGQIITPLDNAGITLKGAEYIESNDSMKRVSKFLGRAFEIAVQSIVKAMG